MSLYRKLKLYRIVTVLKYPIESWNNSREIADISERSRPWIFLDILRAFYGYGHRYWEYQTFRLWEKPDSAKSEYLSSRGNDKLVATYFPRETVDLFANKIAFNERYKNFINRAWIYGKGINDAKIVDFVNKYGRVIIKPVNDYGGHGVSLVTSDMSPEKIRDVTGQYPDGFLAEECIVNRDKIRALAPGSLNTVRVVTLTDKNGKTEVLAALLRMGNGRGIVDNFHAGGIAVPIDINTGRLKESGFTSDTQNIKIHPYSGIRFKDYEIPGFFDCIELLDDLLKVETSARYVGWDFCITPDGIDLLEANIPPGEDITQLAAQKGLRKKITGILAGSQKLG